MVNPAAENVDRLKDIQCGKGITERLLDDVDSGIEDFGGNLLAPQAMERYFYYYFFARRQEMDYPVSAETVGRDDTLLNLLSINTLAMDEYGRNHDTTPNIYFQAILHVRRPRFQSHRRADTRHHRALRQCGAGTDQRSLLGLRGGEAIQATTSGAAIYCQRLSPRPGKVAEGRGGA